MPAQPALAGFAGCTSPLGFAIFLRLDGLLPARRGAQPDLLIRSGAKRLTFTSHLRGSGSPLLQKRLVAFLSTIAL
jgi:hypothetical protein